MADRATAIRKLIAAQPGRSRGTSDYLHRVCRSAATTLAASGTGISVMTDNAVRAACAASDPHSEQIEELQFVLGEGPCLDAFHSRRPILVPDLAAEAAARWPMYGRAAHAGGVCAVFAFPLQVGAARLGVMDVFRDHPGALTDNQLRDALTYADVTTQALLDHHQATTTDSDNGDTNNGGDCGGGEVDEVDVQAELFQAQGMVMVQIAGTINEAVARMRAYAYAEGRPLGDIARDVVARRLHFDRDRP